MKKELFDEFFGPPMNMPSPNQSPNNNGINFMLIGGGLLIVLLLYKLNSQKKEKYKVFL